MPSIDPINRADPGGLTRQLVERLTEAIQSGELRPGDRLATESELVRVHGVSRTVVREAMSRLNAQGLVETQHGRGSFVLTSGSTVPFAVDVHGLRSVDDLRELLDFRSGFEIEAAGLAAQRARSAKIAAIKAALARFTDEVERPSGSLDADFEFHRSVAVASGNRYFVQILDSLGRTAIAAPRARLSMTAPDADAHLRVVVIEHTNIYQAIARRSPADARAAMRIHLANSQQRLVRAGVPGET